MLICLLLLGAALAAPTDDSQGLINEAELTLNDETFLMHIVPGTLTSKKSQKLYAQLSDVVDENSEHYQTFVECMNKGYTSKGLTFNIFDDNIRYTTVALFNMLQETSPQNFNKVKEWAKININNHMFDYAVRLLGIYKNDFGSKAGEPPFLLKPNYYVNSETIIKALKLKNVEDINYQDAIVNQFYKTDNDKIIVINTNYSNWNKLDTRCEKLDYFTEDIALNSYYYGIHLLHPYWMSNEYLDQINSRHAEHYYFRHQQLLARFLLEKESMKQRNITRSESCDDYYNPNLIYDNGLSFPIRSNIQDEFNDGKTKIKAADIVIREYLSRGIVITENQTTVNLTEENHIDLISRLIRASFDGINSAKIVRSMYGYGGYEYPEDTYNPSPSLLQQPETSIRDPAFFYLLKHLQQYFTDFQTSLEPMDMSRYETDDFIITGNNFTKLKTYFDYYQVPVAKTPEQENGIPSLQITARQKRLQHLPLVFNFTVMSKKAQDVAVRLFLGPQCEKDECWNNFSKFYLLDAYVYNLQEGENAISWTPQTSHKLSSDAAFNKEDTKRPSMLEYNIYKFPENLILPKGLEDGLNLTLFVIMTSTEDSNLGFFRMDSIYYNYVTYELDEKPLGFPFHRQSKNYKEAANNYRFYNISVYHKTQPLDITGYFSPHLY